MALTPFEVYGFMEPTIPSGYVVDEFRPPKKGEFFLPTYEVYRRRPDAVKSMINFEDPRLILRPKEYVASEGANVVTVLEDIHVVKPTIKQVYGVDDPKIPDGFRTVDFRRPKAGEQYLGTHENVATACRDHTSSSYPRLILEKLPVRTVPSIADVYPKGYVVPEDYESLGFRRPYFGEHYLGTSGRIVHQYTESCSPSLTVGGGLRVIVRAIPKPEPPKTFRLIRVLEYVGTEKFIQSCMENNAVTSAGPRIRNRVTRQWEAFSPSSGMKIRELSTFKEEVKK